MSNELDRWAVHLANSPRILSGADSRVNDPRDGSSTSAAVFESPPHPTFTQHWASERVCERPGASQAKPIRPVQATDLRRA